MCWSLFLLKLKAFRPATLSKRDSNTDAFLRILQNFQKTYFEKHPQTTGSIDCDSLHATVSNQCKTCG